MRLRIAEVKAGSSAEAQYHADKNPPPIAAACTVQGI